MRPNLVIPGVIALALGFVSMFDGATAGERRTGNITGAAKVESGAAQTVITRTVGWSRYYGRRIYRCRRFSSQCYYYRPAHYVRHWSYSNWTNHGNRPGEAAKLDTHPAKLGHYYINPMTLTSGIFTKPRNARDEIYMGQKVTAYEVSGGFTRITSPGRSARWVRVDSLSANKQEKPSTPNVSMKPRKP
jgi:hypothetical protein